MKSYNYTAKAYERMKLQGHVKKENKRMFWISVVMGAALALSIAMGMWK